MRNVEDKIYLLEVAVGFFKQRWAKGRERSSLLGILQIIRTFSDVVLSGIFLVLIPIEKRTFFTYGDKLFALIEDNETHSRCSTIIEHGHRFTSNIEIDESESQTGMQGN